MSDLNMKNALIHKKCNLQRLTMANFRQYLLFIRCFFSLFYGTV